MLFMIAVIVDYKKFIILCSNFLENLRRLVRKLKVFMTPLIEFFFFFLLLKIDN